MNHRIIQKISLAMAFAGLYTAVDASSTVTLSPQVASLQNLVQSLFAIQGKDADQIFAHAYVPVPYHIHDITFVPMIPGTTAKSVVQGTPITIDAPTEAAIQAAMLQGDLVEIQMAVNSGNLTFTVTDVTAGSTLGNIAQGTISGLLNSCTMIYSYGTGMEAVSQALSVGAGESIQLNQIIPAVLPSSVTQFASFVITFAGSSPISLPINVTLLTAINAAIKQNHNILFSVQVDTDNINLVAKDMTTNKVIGQASMSNSSQLTSSACTIQYNVLTSAQGASQTFSVPLEASEVLMVYATNNLISIPTSSSISNLSINYTAGAQTNQAFQLDAADVLNINSKLQIGDILVMELTAVPALAVQTNPSTTTPVLNGTMQNVVLSVYDSNIGQILTQCLLASHVSNGLSSTVTCTWNNQPAATTTTTTTITKPIASNVITLKVGSGLVLNPMVVKRTSNSSGTSFTASKLQQQGFITLAELITLANSGSKKTLSNSSITKGYFNVQKAILAATSVEVNEYDTLMYAGHPSPRFFGINLGNDIGIGFGNNTGGTPWGCGGPVTTYTDATTSVQGGGTITNFSQLYNKINWTVGSGVKFLMLCFDQNGQLIADLGLLKALNVVRPASVSVFVFDGATQAFLGAVAIKPSNISCSNCVPLSAGGTGSWASNGLGFRVDWANGCGNNSIGYPCVLDINTPAAQQAVTSGESLTFAKMAAQVSKLVDLQQLLLTHAGQKLQSVYGQPTPPSNGGFFGEIGSFISQGISSVANTANLVSGGIAGNVVNDIAGGLENAVDDATGYTPNIASTGASQVNPYSRFTAYDWTGKWPQEISLPGDSRGTGYWYNMPYYMTYGPWIFFNASNWAQNQVASDLQGTTQIMNWGTGVSFVVVAFDANGNYIPNITTTAMAAAYIYTFDTATGQVLGLSPIAPSATRQGDPNGGQPAFNAVWPSGYNTIWNIRNGNPEACNHSPYPSMITYVCTNPWQPSASKTSTLALGTATTFSAFQTLLTQEGVTNLQTVSLAGLPADFTPKIGTQYPNDLSITLGGGTKFTFGSPADNASYLYEYALNQQPLSGKQYVDADLSGVAAQVKDWTKGLILVVLAFDSVGNLVSILPGVPTQFYIFAYDAATERRLDVLKIRSGAIANVAPGSWLSSMTFALGTSNQVNATYPAAIVIKGPALPQPVVASASSQPAAA